ncbi:hypothetical protein FA95DRAFT_1231818 [Auriscalpium vulgare]|uniref:Uncharacterized protein n=1 Tax=Auriscalpium vulgare TaxID=40419 RepID=A0ACB8RUZ3_9AGAM|nr:hypothetical protein FA95DRAFT_1231818 [Auriscalpium vulgare]
MFSLVACSFDGNFKFEVLTTSIVPLLPECPRIPTLSLTSVGPPNGATGLFPRLVASCRGPQSRSLPSQPQETRFPISMYRAFQRIVTDGHLRDSYSQAPHVHSVEGLRPSALFHLFAIARHPTLIAPCQAPHTNPYLATTLLPLNTTSASDSSARRISTLARPISILRLS